MYIKKDANRNEKALSRQNFQLFPYLQMQRHPACLTSDWCGLILPLLNIKNLNGQIF